ncbi:glycosyltransferase [bacterium]|nr:glycosyltransferase [bacterium]
MELQNNISIFIFCHNEEAIIDKTIKHYKKYMPSADIVICDNNSDDCSIEIAEELGCKIIQWGEKNKLSEHQMTHMKNNCWKSIFEGWVIVCDMDEWLCIDEKSLEEEEQLGTSLISTVEYNIVGESISERLEDINLLSLGEGYAERPRMNKCVCFRVPNIKEMNYSHNSHGFSPEGQTSWGGPYLLKHMSWIGLPYKQKLNEQRCEKYGLAVQYRKKEEVSDEHAHHINKKHYIRHLCDCFEDNKSKDCLAVICTRNPKEILLKNIANTKKFYPDFDILVVDGNSTENIEIFEKLPGDVFFGRNNTNYELGAWNHALLKYGDYKQYMFIQDTLVPIARIPEFNINEAGVLYSIEMNFKIGDGGYFDHLKNIYKDTDLVFFAEIDPETPYICSAHSSFISDQATAKRIVFALEKPYLTKKIIKTKIDSWLTERTIGFMASRIGCKRICMNSFFQKTHGGRF